VGLRGKRASSSGGRVAVTLDKGGMELLSGALVGGLLFCVVRGVIDLRDRRFALAAMSLLVSALLLAALVAPVETHGAKVELSSLPSGG
jgi:hypothetical protein